MTQIFREKDATLEPLKGKTVAILGYGNQGSAQALNLRDSGINVIVGNVADSYAAQAKADGFPLYSIAEAAQRGDFVMSMLADEITPAVYNSVIKPGLSAGKTLSFASGYCVCYNQITFPSDINVIMVAPRTMGAIVRDDFLHQRGFLSFVDVHQDVNGQAWPQALALARAIGSLKMYALHVTFKDETELDLLTEQALVPAIFGAIKTTVETALRAGYPQVATVLELYLSGEMGDVLHAAAMRGVVGQTALHSPTSRYGTHSRLPQFTTPAVEQMVRDILTNVQNGSFAEEWSAEQANGYKNFERMQTELRESTFGKAERAVMQELAEATR
jgi:ketol-acid reductoisomerase